MNLPWKGGRIALLAAGAEDRKFRFFLCCAATLGTVALSLLNPQIVRYTIDSVIGDIPLKAPAFIMDAIYRIGGIAFLRSNIWICAFCVLAAAAFSALLDIVRNYTSIEIGETIAWKLRNTLYSHIQKLPYDWHISCQTGDIIQRCTSDVDNIRNFIQWQLSEFMRTISVFIIAVIIMFSMDIFMSLMSLTLIPLILAFSIAYFRQVSHEFNRADIAEGIMQAAAQENYTGVRVVRAFGRESYEMEKFSGKTRNYQIIWNYIGKMLGVFWGTGDFLSGCQLIIVLGAGVWRTAQGQLSPGTFIAFYAYCNWMIWPIRQLGRILAELSKTLVASGRIREILATVPETDPGDALTPDIKGEICFKNVSFNYGKDQSVLQPVLHDISFTLKPGESLAILGATGSGKSTMVHILSRLYDLKDSEGRITIDGIDIRRISRTHLRRNIGLCLQEPFLFSKTIRENISIAKPEMELTELRAAASVAMIDETIMGFAEAYNTVIGERGVTISGWQKQCVAITRMLAGNTPVMIFDDSLSAVDTETDTKIRSALRRHVNDAAVIIISHRISSLMQADKILVLKNGTMEELGSHEELISRNGTYRRIFDLQRGMTEE